MSRKELKDVKISGDLKLTTELKKLKEELELRSEKEELLKLILGENNKEVFIKIAKAVYNVVGRSTKKPVDVDISVLQGNG